MPLLCFSESGELRLIRDAYPPNGDDHRDESVRYDAQIFST